MASIGRKSWPRWENLAQLVAPALRRGRGPVEVSPAPLRLRICAPPLPFGRDQTLVFVNGYLTNGTRGGSWVEAFRAAGWQGSIRVLDWDTGGNVLNHVTSISLGSILATEAAYSTLYLVPGVGTVLAAARGPRLIYKAAKVATAACHGASAALEHWDTQVATSEAAGQQLADLLAQLGQKKGADHEVFLAGFSLGARVIRRALWHLHGSKTSLPLRIRQVDLFGGAVPLHSGWEHVAEVVDGPVRNFHSQHDAVLSTLFTVAEAAEPIGLAGGAHPLQNHDVSHLVNSHFAYATALGQGPLRYVRDHPRES